MICASSQRMKYRKRFGQNFLTDEVVINRILSAINLRESDKVIEIGPGGGAITSGLYEIARDGYRAIEIDRDLVLALRVAYPKLRLVNEDVLKVDFEQLLPERSFSRIVGNLPYNITTPIFFKLLSVKDRSKIRDLHFMIQKEVAERLTASPGTKNWGRLSILIQIYFQVKQLFDVAPGSFKPEPKVWSSFVKLVPKATDLDVKKMEVLDRVLRAAFSGRRKTIRNSLKNFGIDWSGFEIESTRRADDLAINDYLSVVDFLSETI